MADNVKPPARITTLIACAERELAMRRGVYPKWVKAGRMTQEKADAEIAGMEAIVGVLRTLKSLAGTTEMATLAVILGGWPTFDERPLPERVADLKYRKREPD